MQRCKVLLSSLAVIAFLLSALSPASAPVTIADQSVLAHFQAASNYTVYVSGDVIGTDFYLITADFKAELTNNRTTQNFFSAPFGHGRFQVALDIPRDALDNDTFTVRVVSLDGTTVYGTSYVRLNDSSSGKDYAIDILVLNPPPNYNGIIILVLLIVFACILAGYIFFVRWLIGRMVVGRANEIMIERQMNRRGRGPEGGGDGV